MKKIEIPKERLKELYLIKNLKISKIADKYNCSEACISKKLKQFGLSKRVEDGYIGKKFGKLMPIKMLGRDKNGHAIFECLCDCGKNFETLGFRLKTKNTNTCGCASRKRGKDHENYKGYEEISSSLWSSLKRGALHRKLKFEVSIEDIWQLFLDQGRRCALSGVVLIFAKTRKEYKLTTASLDRIDSSKGYVKGNLQWVHKNINMMKWNLSQSDFIKWAKLVANYN